MILILIESSSSKRFMAGISLDVKSVCQMSLGVNEAEENTLHSEETAAIRIASFFRPACHITAGSTKLETILNAND